MFPDCYLNYMNNYYRAVTPNPEPHANQMPEAFPMPSPEMFDESIQEGENIPMEQNIMGGGTMPSGPMQGNPIPSGTPMGGPTQGIPMPSGTPMGGTMQGIPMPGGTTIGNTLPSGAEQGTTTPMGQGTFEIQPGAPVMLDTEYTQGYLRTQIGKRMRVTFLLGTNQIQDREGVLEDVGISYIILRETQTNNLTLCDIYSIKFVVIFPTV